MPKPLLHFLRHDLTQNPHRVAFFSFTENLETDVSHSFRCFDFRNVIQNRDRIASPRGKAKAAAAEKTLKDMMHRVVGPVVVAFCIFENLHSLRECTLIRNNNCCQREPVLPKASRLLDRN